MDVFLLPVTPAPLGSEPLLELYCEPPPDPDAEPGDADAQAKRGFFARMVLRFKQALAEGEAEQRREEKGEPEHPGEKGSRVGRFVKRKLAAAVAEQRVLWQLRNATAARLHHPVTITSPRAIELAIAEFKKDFAKHRLWCVIDGVIVIATGVVAIVPGPNLLAYYFIFRAVGHFFSFQGARKGMNPALWTAVASAPLADLQQALSLDTKTRTDRIAAVEAALGLERLSVFMRRVASRPRQA
jgi:hypothetical protein